MTEALTEKQEPKKIYRTYQIHIKKGHKLYPYFQELCHNANNLYNTTNFYIRQVHTSFKQNKTLEPLQQEVMDTIEKWLPIVNDNQLTAYHKKMSKEKSKPTNERKEIKANLFESPTKEKSFVGYNFLDALFKTMKQKDYVSLPGQINQQVIKNAVQNWKSFFENLKDYQIYPEKYKARPNIPSYLPKGERKEVILSNQICKIKDEKYLRFPKIKGQLNIGKLANLEGSFQQVRVIPYHNYYTLEMIFYLGEQNELTPLKNRCMSIDLGLNNLATIVTNTEMKPILFKGGKIKAINQWYNKKRSYYVSILRNGLQKNEGQHHSKYLNKLNQKRHYRIKDLFHKISYQIIQKAKEENIDTIIIGKNENWKQESNMGTKNNQNFVQVPHTVLINMIKYKAEFLDIAVIMTEESYTSKASFLDEDEIPTFQAGNQEKHVFSGKRVKRGLYRSKLGILINADVNGAYNILRKVVPNAIKTFANGIEAFVSTPQVVNVR